MQSNNYREGRYFKNLLNALAILLSEVKHEFNAVYDIMYN